MKPLKIQELSSRQWVIILAAVAGVFVFAIACSLVNALSKTEIESLGESTRVNIPSGDNPLSVSSAQMHANQEGGKHLPLPPAPVRPELADQTTLYLPPQEAHVRAARDQTSYLKEQIEKHPKSSFGVTPEELDKMQKEGRMAW